MSKPASPGDIIAVPVGSTFALGKVLFVSQHFRDVMYVEFRGPFGSELTEWDDGEYLGAYYTAASKFQKRGWKIVGARPVLDADLAKTLRIVATDVWEQDNLLRKATKEDQRTIPIMGVDGFIRVESMLKNRMEKASKS